MSIEDPNPLDAIWAKGRYLAASEAFALAERVITDAMNKLDAANEDAARLAEALRYEASLHPYPADVPDSVKEALRLHDERVR